MCIASAAGAAAAPITGGASLLAALGAALPAASAGAGIGGGLGSAIGGGIGGAQADYAGDQGLKLAASRQQKLTDFQIRQQALAALMGTR